MAIRVTIPCSGTHHELSFNNDGAHVDPEEHDLELEKSLVALGGPTPECLLVQERWSRGAVRKCVQMHTVAFADAFWESYEQDRSHLPFEESMGPVLYAEFLAALLTYEIEDQYRSFDTDRAIELVDILQTGIAGHVPFPFFMSVNESQSKPNRALTYVSLNYSLGIATEADDQTIFTWSDCNERQVYDPYYFDSSVQQFSEFETFWNYHPVLSAVISRLEHKHGLKFPKTTEPPELPPLPDRCEEGQRCPYALVYMGDIDGEGYGDEDLTVIQYPDIRNVLIGLEIADITINNFLNLNEERTNERLPAVVIARRRTADETLAVRSKLRLLMGRRSQRALPIGIPPQLLLDEEEARTKLGLLPCAATDEPFTEEEADMLNDWHIMTNDEIDVANRRSPKPYVKSRF